MLRVIQFFLNYRKQETEAARKAEAARKKAEDERVEAERKDYEHKEILRNKDREVDPILRSLI